MRPYRYKEAILFRQIAPMSLLGLIAFITAALFGAVSWENLGFLVAGLFIGLSIGYWRCTAMYVEAQSNTNIWIPDSELGFAGNEGAAKEYSGPSL